jgi:glycerophosphoryl diester phosphodiesterase
MNRKPLIIGHRGASAVAPENTIGAFKKAVQVGADGIEFDVQLSRDGIPVIIHDDNLRRTGLLDRRVADLSAEELSRIEVSQWFWRKHGLPEPVEREGVPTLQEVFQLYQSNPGVLYLEMKCAATQANELARACCEMISATSLKDRIIVESFDLSAIAEVKRIDPSIKTAALFEPKLNSPQIYFGRGIIGQATDVGADEIAVHHTLVRERLIRWAKEAGLAIVVWTVDDPRWIKKAHELQIDALITNNPAVMIEGNSPTAQD